MFMQGARHVLCISMNILDCTDIVGNADHGVVLVVVNDCDSSDLYIRLG